MSNIVARIDIDAIMAAYDIETFIANVKTDIDLDANSIPDYFSKIKSIHRIRLAGRRFNPAELPQFKLGSISTNLGVLNVYLLSLHAIDNFEAHVLESTKAFASSDQAVISRQFMNVSASTDIRVSGKLVAAEFRTFFMSLGEKLGEIAILLETFGNKNSATAIITG